MRSYTDIPESFDQNGLINIDKQRELIHGYYACVSYIDAQVGKILKAVKENNLLEKLLVFFNFEKTLNIKDLSRRLEEDFALMFNGNMELGSICFPSGWDFSEKLGKNFAFIHEPVADNSKLIASSQKLSEYMCKQTIQRWVWTVTTSKELSEHPKLTKPGLTTFENLYFRVETQTSTPIDKNTSLFLIKVEVFPLRNVWDPKILDSINSMSESVLNYKGLVEIKDLLNTMKL